MTTYTADATPAQQIEALNTIIEGLLKDVAALREATKSNDAIYCWPSIRLAVRVVDGKPLVCGIAEADPLPKLPKGRVFTNGTGATAELWTRSVVAKEALKSYEATLQWAQEKRCSLIARVLPSIVEA